MWKHRFVPCHTLDSDKVGVKELSSKVSRTDADETTFEMQLVSKLKSTHVDWLSGRSGF